MVAERSTSNEPLPSFKKQQSLTIFKICLSGKYGVGKTAIFKVVSNRLDDENIGFDRFEYNIDGFAPKIALYDTAGREQYASSLTMSNYYRNAHAIIMVYDVTDIESLHYLQREMTAIKECGIDEATRLVLVRNKMDKVPISVSKEYEERFIKNLSPLFRNLDYTVSVSALQDKGSVIRKLFYEDLAKILQGQTPSKSTNVFEPVYKRESTSNCC